MVLWDAVRQEAARNGPAKQFCQYLIDEFLDKEEA